MSTVSSPTLTRRQRLWFAAEGNCHWCGCLTRLVTHVEPDQATTDHVVPMGRGGSNDEDNVVLACHACNQRRNHEDQLNLRPAKNYQDDKALQGQAKAMNRLIAQRDGALARIAELTATLHSVEEQRERWIQCAQSPLWKIAAKRISGWWMRRSEA